LKIVLRRIYGTKREKIKEAGENCVMFCIIFPLSQIKKGGNRPFGRLRHSCEVNIRMDFREVGRKV
jgi:hypothetical protein